MLDVSSALGRRRPSEPPHLGRASLRAFPRGPECLTPREIEVLGLVAVGASNFVIADCLGISVQTVKNHLSSIFGKLAVNRRRKAARIVFPEPGQPELVRAVDDEPASWGSMTGQLRLLGPRAWPASPSTASPVRR